MRRFLWWLSGFLRVREIHVNGALYLERYELVRCCGWVVYLHRFELPDAEPWLHDHPWRWALALPLLGGYLEARLQHLDGYDGPVVRFIERRPWRPYVLRAHDFHRIEALARRECWTLFVHSPRFRMWGFLRRLEAGTTAYWQPFQKSRAEDFPADAPRARDLRAARARK